MLRFSKKSTGRPRDYFRRREQWRLLLLVFLLGGTVVVVMKVSNPEFWATALARLGIDESEQTQVDNANDEYTPYVPPTDDRAADSIEIVSEYQRQQIADGRDRLPGVNLEYLAQVKDNRPHHRTEIAARLNLFDQLINNDPSFLKAVARKDVGYVQLYWQPEEYRGQLVAIKGQVRRTEKVAFRVKNSLGIDSYYRLMLQVRAGAKQSRPVFVHALELPKDFPVQFDMREEVEITGFSYKKLPYARADGEPEIAPVMLVGPVEWIPEVASSISPKDVLLATAGIAVVVVLATWYFSRPGSLILDDEAIADAKNVAALAAEHADDEVALKVADPDS